MIVVRYVEHIPEHPDLEPNTLYICAQYDTMTHLCPCPCGDEIAVPLDVEIGWVITVTDGLATATPSFANRRCKAHYVITNGEFVFC